MIISASRRTDIPARYSEWFMNRVRSKEVLVPNPYNRKKVSRISLAPEVVDAVVFWTKNPEPMLPYLKELDQLGYCYCFQVTITDYEEDLEPEIPCTADVMATFLLMSEMLGKERMEWRFDPILLTDRYTKEYHLEQFEMMCEWLHPAAERCIISFVDDYKGNTLAGMGPEDMEELAEGLGKIAGRYGISLCSCAEKIDLERYGITHGACIDPERIRRITGYKLDLKKDARQRRECRCAENIDIGTYDTCIGGCKYCYAVNHTESARKKYEQHDPQSSLLIGQLRGDETITDREVRSAKDNQLSLFDLPQLGTGNF